MNNEINTALERYKEAKQHQDEIDKQIVSLEELKSGLLKEKAEKEQQLAAQSSAESDGLIYGENKTLKGIAQLKGTLLMLDDRITAINGKTGQLKGQLVEAYLVTKNHWGNFNTAYATWLDDEAIKAIEAGLTEALKPAASFIRLRKQLTGNNPIDFTVRQDIEWGVEKLVSRILHDLASSASNSADEVFNFADDVLRQGHRPVSLSHEEIKLLSTPAGRHKLKGMARAQ